MAGNRAPAIADAPTWAREVSADEVDPVLLEAHVARHHDEKTLFSALGGKVTHTVIEEGTERLGPTRPRSKAVEGTATVAETILMLAPLAGLAPFLVGGVLWTGYEGQHFLTDPLPLERALLFSAVGFWVAVLYPPRVLFDWVRRRRRWDTADLIVQVYVIACAALTLRVLSNANIDITDLVSAAPVLPIWIASTLSIVALAMIALFSRRLTPAENRYRIVLAQRPHEHKIAEAVAAMSSKRRSQLLDERNAALAILHERGLLTDAAYAQALRADLGRLG